MEKNKINFLYIFPNLFTAASIFLGVISILSAAAGNYEKAAWLIILSTLFDALDGRVARMTNTQSKFGGEFDSLADVIAFGVAPAFLLYFSYAHNYGKFGILVIALFVIFGAIRLARFNVISSEVEANVFIGLPIPAAALFVVSWVLIFENYTFFHSYAIFLIIFTLLAGVLMVSNVRYPSFKKVDFKKAHFVKGLIGLIVLFSLIFLYPVEMLCVMSTLFLFYGVGRYLYTMITRWSARPKQ
jgi:CDP-diacylglycerol--serine O-phosphatidyltransferase